MESGNVVRVDAGQFVQTVPFVIYVVVSMKTEKTEHHWRYYDIISLEQEKT